jgi:hypothetical protein
MGFLIPVSGAMKVWTETGADCSFCLGGAAAGANLIDGGHFDNPGAAAGRLERRRKRGGGALLFSLKNGLEKITQRFAGLVGRRFAEFHVTPAIPGRGFQDRKVEREISVGIDDEPDRAGLSEISIRSAGGIEACWARLGIEWAAQRETRSAATSNRRNDRTADMNVPFVVLQAGSDGSGSGCRVAL